MKNLIFLLLAVIALLTSTITSSVAVESKLFDKQFILFWDQVVREVDRTKLNVEMRLDDKRSRGDIKVYEITYKSIDNVAITGWFYYREPAKGQKIPAMLLLHGYKMVIHEPQYDYLANVDMAVLQIDLRGNGRSTQDYLPKSEYILDGIMRPSSYVYRGAVADCLTGIRVLEGENFIDKDKIFVNGGSQGGGLSLITAALAKNKVFCCISDEPFLTDFPIGIKYAQSGPYKTLRDHMTARPELAGAMSNTLQYFDTKNFVSMIECPVYLTVGGKDVICPPLTILNLMDKFRTNVELKRYPNAAHNVIGPDYFREKYQWLKPLLDK